MRGREVVPLLSDLLAAEIARGPEPVRDLLGQMLEAGGERLETTEAALALQEAYLAAGIVRPASADDALHVALATLARADVLVSWNFRHLVHPARVRAFIWSQPRRGVWDAGLSDAGGRGVAAGGTGR